ncbi:MAG: M48 family metallopeptidase [Rhodospirillaceae bacterium]|jgi:beta-barrel assembly-enhancing protease|nr:M48 family metallopeptidase [Rhodospirillaceae bacterium]MBT5666415.1 M48 family metallopeptidase [Rhodospirillaceae bacterium]MBT5809008.1 M48 family metallopeptidase [Rhodospirillaceae bacterium]
MTTFAAMFGDGETARRRPVTVTLEPATLSIFGEDGGFGEDGARLDQWPLDELHFVGEAFDGAPVRLKRGAAGQARLTIDDPAFHDVLLRAAPHLRRNPNLNVRKIVGLTAGAAALVAAAIFILLHLTNVVADWLPESWKRDAGERMVTEVLEIMGDNGALCDQPDGAAALDQLTTRLLAAAETIPEGDRLDVKIRVANLSLNNAFAMLGGRIVVLNGLLFNAKSPDEAAGVLAHEIGHVMRHHPSRALMRGIGLGLVFDLFLGGGRTAGFGQAMLSLSYSRDAERDADAIALAILDSAGISGAGLAAFLDRLPDDGDGPGWLSTHPDSQNRAALIRAHQGPQNTTPALTTSEWRALNGICQAAPKG